MEKEAQSKKFREHGTIGALLDEYEKALSELLETIQDIAPNQLTKVIDNQTKDDDCRSIQSILTHLVQSGYTYVVEVRKWLGEEIDYREKVELNHVEAYKAALLEMFRFNEQLFEDYPNIKLTEYESDRKIKVRWGQSFDVEQLFQHAIVHILRHRRQIQKFKLEL